MLLRQVIVMLRWGILGIALGLLHAQGRIVTPLPVPDSHDKYTCEWI